MLFPFLFRYFRILFYGDEILNLFLLFHISFSYKNMFLGIRNILAKLNAAITHHSEINENIPPNGH